MSDPFEDLMKKASGAPEVPSTPDAQIAPPVAVDPIDELLKKAVPGTEAAPVARPEEDPIDQLVKRAAPEPTPELVDPYSTARKPFQDVFLDSVHRGVNQIKATVPILQGVTAEW